MRQSWSDLRGLLAAGCLLLSAAPGVAQVATAPAQPAPAAQTPPAASPADRFAIPATDDGLPGTGPIRRFDWFQALWKQRRSLWATQVQRDQGAVVFLGDSITQGWGLGLNAVFPGMKIANRGISGDTTRGLLIRLKEDVLDLNPRAVVLLIGTNDLEEKATPETIDSDFRLLIATLKAHNPKMPIVACLVMPSSVAMRRPAEDIRKINALRMASIKGDPQIVPLDTWTLFADKSGEPFKDEFPDILHPNDYGYVKFAAALRPIFATLGLLETEPDYFTPEAGFESLFNGKDLTGWGYRPTSEADKESAKRWQASDPNAAAWPFVTEAVWFDGKTESPDGRFKVVNGRLVVTTPPEARRIQQIWTKREFPKDFVLKLEFRATPNADSGVYLRGPQLQCRDYGLAGPFTNLTKYKPQDWNEMVVTVQNGVPTATVNGEKLGVELKLPPTGPIGLEGDRGQMEYRRIRIKTSDAAAAAKPAFDQALATKVGADDYGMRNYVLVILKTGPTKVPAGPERDAMFKGHFANMERLSTEGKLALAGPFGGSNAADGWRGLFIFAVTDVEEAKALVATDPVIAKGEMVAEYHKWYGSAATMLVPDAHGTVAKKSF